MLYIAAMWIAGVMQGLMWRAVNADGTLTYTFVESVKATYPVLRDPPARRRCCTSPACCVMAWNVCDDRRQRPSTRASMPRRWPPQRPQPDHERRHDARAASSHEKIETNNFLMIVLILLVVAVGGLVEIVPLFFQKSTTEPVAGLKPYTPLQLAGRDIYIREGCYNCHSQMIRPVPRRDQRYGHYSVAGEFVYDHPFQWGSKRTGPDLHRVGGTLQRRVAPHAPDQPARPGARIEHAGLSVARAARRSTRRDIAGEA